MKRYYVEDFVTPRYWVSLDFDSLILEKSDRYSLINILRIIFATIMVIVMLVCMVKFWWFPCILSAFLGVFLLLMNWLQSTMDVFFPRKFIIVFALILLAATVISMGVDKHLDNVKLAKELALAEQKHQAEVAQRLEQERLAKEEEQKRLDSLSFHLNAASSLLTLRKRTDAILEYKQAVYFADSVLANNLYYKIANLYFSDKQYEDALVFYKKSKDDVQYKDTLQYNKAVCYASHGDIASASDALKKALRTRRVEALFNKLNPVKTRINYVDTPVTKKRVSYYTTLCRDGSTSSSNSHRGACSRHGGVYDWNHPIYESYTVNQKKKVIEKYRKYGELWQAKCF